MVLQPTTTDQTRRRRRRGMLYDRCGRRPPSHLMQLLALMHTLCSALTTPSMRCDCRYLRKLWKCKLRRWRRWLRVESPRASVSRTRQVRSERSASLSTSSCATRGWRPRQRRKRHVPSSRRRLRFASSSARSAASLSTRRACGTKRCRWAARPARLATASVRRAGTQLS